MNAIQVFLEISNKKTFCGAIHWPGWCRSGRDEESALGAMVDYGIRYAQVLQVKDIKFQVPLDASDLNVTERHTGNATTDFGAPAAILEADQEPMDASDFERLINILQACWEAYDRAWKFAFGKELRKGPRGGGRDLKSVAKHVLEARLLIHEAAGVEIQTRGTCHALERCEYPNPAGIHRGVGGCSKMGGCRSVDRVAELSGP